MSVRRALSASLAVAGIVALSASCQVRSVDLSNCDEVYERCYPYCSTWCDSWGCYPRCYTSCSYECIQYPDPPPATPVPPPAPATDAGAPPPAPAEDGGAGAPPVRSELLCRTCSFNDECGAAGLCIRRGGSPDAGTGDAGAEGFCGQACTGAGPSSNCPSSYDCSAIGSSRQCIPTSGSCVP